MIRGFLEQLRFPWLFVLLAVLWFLDMFIPDPLPLVDELILATLTVMAASWRRPVEAGKPPEKNVTPPEMRAKDVTPPGNS